METPTLIRMEQHSDQTDTVCALCPSRTGKAGKGDGFDGLDVQLHHALSSLSLLFFQIQSCANMYFIINQQRQQSFDPSPEITLQDNGGERIKT